MPFGKTLKDRIYFLDLNGQKVNSLFIGNVKTYLNPDESQIDKANLLTLIKFKKP